MTATEILETWLKENGYDGLWNSYQCGCLIGDLMPCGCGCGDCEPGYKWECRGCSEECVAIGSEGHCIKTHKQERNSP